MGCEIATTTAPLNDTAAPPAGANEDLLSQIFGGVPTNSGPAPSAPANKQKAIDDISGLIGPSGGAAALPAASPTATPLASLSVKPQLPHPHPHQRQKQLLNNLPRDNRRRVHCIRDERTEGLPPTTGFRCTTRCGTRHCTVRSYWSCCCHRDQLPSCGAQGMSCV